MPKTKLFNDWGIFVKQICPNFTSDENELKNPINIFAILKQRTFWNMISPPLLYLGNTYLN